MDNEVKFIRDFFNEITFKNRYFLDEKFNKYLNSVIDNKRTVLDKGDIFYRGRIQEANRKRPYPPNKMGIPKTNIKTTGRFNPYGINHLYLATDIETVVAEIRPNLNSLISIATYELIEDIEIVNLTDKHAIADWNPEIDIASLALIIGGFLSKPIEKAKENLDYLPMQYFGELCKANKLHGIKYFSSLFNQDPDKSNLMLFGEDKVRCNKVTTILVDSIKYEYKQSNKRPIKY